MSSTYVDTNFKYTSPKIKEQTSYDEFIVHLSKIPDVRIEYSGKYVTIFRIYGPVIHLVIEADTLQRNVSLSVELTYDAVDGSPNQKATSSVTLRIDDVRSFADLTSVAYSAYDQDLHDFLRVPHPFGSNIKQLNLQNTRDPYVDVYVTRYWESRGIEVRRVQVSDRFMVSYRTSVTAYLHRDDFFYNEKLAALHVKEKITKKLKSLENKIDKLRKLEKSHAERYGL